MKKTVVQKEVFITCDGVQFENESDANKHEEKWSLLRDLNQAIPLPVTLNNQYITIFINKGSFELLRERIKDVFTLSNPENLVEGWNLIHDKGREAKCFSINKFFETPAPVLQQSMTIEEQQKVNDIKKAIYGIVRVNSNNPASPEGKLGNIIMQLQDLIK